MKKSSINSTSNEDILKTYFLRIKDIPVLTAKEEQDLSRRILGGDSEATRQLIESNLKLVVKIAKGYISADIPLMDLIQEGNIGLLKAVKKFDYRRNVRFSTYASWWIKQSITRALSNKKRCIRLPHRKEDMLRKIQKTSLDLSQHLMRKPSIDEVAHYIKMERHEVQDILNLSNGIVSMDSENREENGNLHDVLEDYTYSPDKLFMKKIMREDALKFLKQLFPKEQQVLLYRFAFVGGDRYTLKRSSRLLSISPETVRQLEMRALQKLKEQAVELKEYVYD
jgi:RNA polymerase primary sigma factor